MGKDYKDGASSIDGRQTEAYQEFLHSCSYRPR